MKGAGIEAHRQQRNERDAIMQRNVKGCRPFDRSDIQVQGFWSNVHEGFYVVTGFGFPTFIYVKHLDRWLCAASDLMTPDLWSRIYPREIGEVEMVSSAVLTDIYRRGMAGMVKHRILGKVKG